MNVAVMTEGAFLILGNDQGQRRNPSPRPSVFLSISASASKYDMVMILHLITGLKHTEASNNI